MVHQRFVRWGVLAAIGAFVAPVGADSVVFDFEGFAGTTSVPSPGAFTSLNDTAGGVSLTISRTSGQAFDVFSSENVPGFFPASWGSKHLDPFFAATTADAFVANISAPGNVTGVSIEYGDFSGDAGDVRFQVWSGADGSGTLLSDQTQSWSGDLFVDDPGSFTFAGSGIGSIVFWGELGSFPNSLYWDNLGVEFSASVIPLPTGGAMALVGLLGVASRRRR